MAARDESLACSEARTLRQLEHSGHEKQDRAHLFCQLEPLVN